MRKFGNFLFHLIIAIGLFVLLVLGTLWALGVITNHGQYERVPEIMGKDVREAVRILEGQGFEVDLQDSTWDETKPPRSILKQTPLANAEVKSGRTIYLTVNRSQPPLVEVPNFVGLSFRNAELYLKQMGLRLGDTLRKPDIAKDAVLEQLYNNRQLAPGTEIFEGSVVSFVLGSGLGTEEMRVPVLVGQTFTQARNTLLSLGLNPGALIVDADVRDTANAFVYRQNPETETPVPEGTPIINKIRPGQSMDIWLSRTRASIMNDTTRLE